MNKNRNKTILIKTHTKRNKGLCKLCFCQDLYNTYRLNCKDILNVVCINKLAARLCHDTVNVGVYTVSPKTCDYIFYNNFNNRCPITIIFGIDIAVIYASLCVIERWFHFPPHLSSATLGNHRTQKMTNFAVSNILFCE